MKQMQRSILLLIGIIIAFACIKFYFVSTRKIKVNHSVNSNVAWIGPDITSDTTIKGEERSLILYGQDLIAHTSKYFGPKGSVSKLTNGMNCQNCHLNAGNQPWGNNYGAVFSTYPKYRDRSGTVESIYKRVSDCMERSLNGKALDSNSREYTAIYSYIKYLGKNVQKDKKPIGSGIEKIKLLDRPADPQKGKIVYVAKCQICHGNNGQGQLLGNNEEYAYPPVWGEHSYNDGAGLYRISNLAGFLKNNMPYLQTSHERPVLTEAQSWDLAAFINTQPRPHMNPSKDWPNIKKKPFDYPYGPYADSFSEQQHKFGPYQIMIKNSLVK
jgi:thiosulfate dehydrogenase